MSKKHIRKAALSTLAASAAVVAAAPVSAATQVSFKDVTPKTVGNHYDAIMKLAGDGTIKGYDNGTFKPYNNLTRSQVALMLKRSLNLDVPANKSQELAKYKDLPKNLNKETTDAIAAVSSAKVFEGQKGQFNLWKNMTREQMASVLVRAYDLEKLNTGKDVKMNISKVSSTHKKNVQILGNLGLTNEVGDADFRPFEAISRAQFASFIYRAQNMSTDKEAPVITLEGDKSVNVAYGKEVELPKVTVKDNVDKDIELKSVITDADGKTIDKIDTKKPGTYTVTYSAEDAAGNKAKEVSVKVVVQAEGVPVEKVVKIDKNAVTVKTPKVDKDRFNETLTVIDNNGNRVAVEPAVIAANDEEVMFKFKTPVDKQEGVWTIGDKKYDFDAAANVEAFRNAGSQLQLNKVFENLGIVNVKAENLGQYVDKKVNFISDSDKEGQEITKDRIQSFVNNVNEEIENGEASTELAKKVNEAIKSNNDVALKDALQNIAFKRVNPDWLAGTDSYKSEIASVTDADNKNSVNEIQTLIDNVNKKKVGDAAGQLADSTDKSKINEIKALINNYLAKNDDGSLTENATKWLQKADVQSAIVDIREAQTPNVLEAAVKRLAELENTKDVTKIDLEKYISENGKTYQKEIEKLDVKNTADVVKAIDDGNKAAGQAQVIAVQKAAETGNADTLLKALKAYPGIKNVADINKEVYKTGDFKNTEDVQAEVNKQNVQAVEKAQNADQLFATLQALGIQNVTEANKGDYFTDGNGKFSEITGDVYEEQVSNIQQIVNNSNGTVNTAKALKQINEGKTPTEVKTGLDTLALKPYLNIPTEDRLYIAQKVMEQAKEQAYAGTGAVGNALYTDESTGIVQDYKKKIADVNSLTKTSKPTDVIKELDKIGNEKFDELNKTSKSTVAQVFLKNAEFGQDGKVLPFNTLASVNKALEEAMK